LPEWPSPLPILIPQPCSKQLAVLRRRFCDARPWPGPALEASALASIPRRLGLVRMAAIVFCLVQSPMP